VDARRELADIEGRLTAAQAKATEARDRYEDWKRKSSEIQSKALESIDTARRAEAQEQFNQVMNSIDSSALDSSLTQATEAIEDRAARADAEASLNEDPEERALRNFEKSSRNDDIDAVLKEFQTETPADTETAAA
jgi:phage shock protein A